MFVKKSAFLFGVIVIVITLLALNTNSARAAPIDKFPVTVTQPDGTELNLFASGDEFYNWLQDEQGYTVIQDPDSGYYVYADLVDGLLIPTQFIVGETDPALEGLLPFINIAPEQIGEIRQTALDLRAQAIGEIHNGPNVGTINNLVIFIRFLGEAEFSNPLSLYTNMLNSTTAGANSLRNYFTEVSYGALTVNSSLFPIPGSTVVSYEDSHTRGYYQPWSVTNTGGYTGGDDGEERGVREMALLSTAIAYVNNRGQFPAGNLIDGNGDGYVDSLTFIASGAPTAWSTLLWPHMSGMYDGTMINGKAVGSYAFQLDSVLNNGVLAHEMFHVLGAPDLYHYTDNDIQPVGGWDVMEYNANPPEHMSCYMKYKYGGWIPSLTGISATGFYILNSQVSPANNCFKIASPNSTTEYFVVEYRNRTGTFETSLPGSGLLVYRINTAAEDGNADGPPDEVYLYRPGGTNSVNGTVNAAHFSSQVGRTEINDTTDPSSFLSTGSAGGLRICNVGASGGESITFNLGCVDDRYEQNDTLVTSYFLEAYERTWLSNVNGIGFQGDDDWYRIYVEPGSAGLIVDLRFAHAQGDIDLDLYNAAGTLIASSPYASDNEYLNVAPITAGYHYLKVYYGDKRNMYDLWWDDYTYQTLTVGKTGSGSGTVTGSGISCGADCTESYISDTVTTLTATSAAGSMFTGWSGACSGTASTCAITMATAKSVTATFTLKKFMDASLWTSDFSYYPQGWRANLHPRVMGDVNGDGRDDVIGFGYSGVLVGLSNGSSFNPVTAWTSDFSYYPQGWRADMHPREIGDVNGDGRDDIIGFGYSGILVALSNGSSFNPVTVWSTNFSYAEGWRMDTYPRMVGNVNGDLSFTGKGIADVVGFGYSGASVGISNGGSGFNSLAAWTSDFSYSPQGWRANLHPRVLGDVNGDKKDDVIGFGYGGVLIALSNGSSFSPVSLWTDDFSYNQGWRMDTYPRMVGDVNGDGKDDLIGFGYSGVLVALAK